MGGYKIEHPNGLAVILYSGRWYGVNNPAHHRDYVGSHLRYLIQPLVNAKMLVKIVYAGEGSQLCYNGAKSEQGLQASLEQAFPGIEVASAVFPEAEMNPTMMGNQIVQTGEVVTAPMTEWDGDYLTFRQTWRPQLINLGRANDLRKSKGWDDGPNTLLIRARLDIMYTSEINQASVGMNSVAAHFVNSIPMSLNWRDWTYFMHETCLTRLVESASKSPPNLIRTTGRRCNGFCQEEQNTLQLEHAGCNLVPLNGGGPAYPSHGHGWCDAGPNGAQAMERPRGPWVK